MAGKLTSEEARELARLSVERRRERSPDGRIQIPRGPSGIVTPEQRARIVTRATRLLEQAETPREFQAALAAWLRVVPPADAGPGAYDELVERYKAAGYALPYGPRPPNST